MGSRVRETRERDEWSSPRRVEMGGSLYFEVGILLSLGPEALSPERRIHLEKFRD